MSGSIGPKVGVSVDGVLNKSITDTPASKSPEEIGLDLPPPGTKPKPASKPNNIVSDGANFTDAESGADLGLPGEDPDVTGLSPDERARHLATVMGGLGDLKAFDEGASGNMIMQLMFALLKEHHEDKRDSTVMAKSQALAFIAEKVAAVANKIEELHSAKEDAQAKAATSMTIGLCQMGLSVAQAGCSFGGAEVQGVGQAAGTASGALGTINGALMANIEANSRSWEIKEKGALLEVRVAQAEIAKAEAEKEREVQADNVKNCMDLIKQLIQIDSQAKQTAINVVR